MRAPAGLHGPRSPSPEVASDNPPGGYDHVQAERNEHAAVTLLIYSIASWARGDDYRDGTPGTGGSSPMSHHVPPPRGECIGRSTQRAGHHCTRKTDKGPVAYRRRCPPAHSESEATPVCAYSAFAPNKRPTIPSRATSEWPRNGIAGRALRGAIHRCPVATPARAED